MLTAFIIFVLSTMVIVVALAALLHIQFGLTGIVNFGVVGFWGLGLYGIAVLLTQMDLPYWFALPATVVLVGVVSFALGWLILELDDQAVLVATLAFASIVNLLLITEKWLTKGVVGLGVVSFPYDIDADLVIGDSVITTATTELSFLILLSIVAGAFMWYARRMRGQPFGRLLVAIQDHEALARGLGKPTYKTKLVVFTLTGALMGFVGALSASVYQFLVPQMVVPTLTFTVWIALVLGGRRHWAGALIGAIIVVALFDIVLELWFELPREFQQLVPQLEFLVYGLLLMALIFYRPQGLLGVYRPKPPTDREPPTDG